jgi:hypothetical protein
MRVAFISPYRDQTGYGEASIGLIRSLKSVGVDVVPIWTNLSSSLFRAPEDIKKMEEGSLDGIDFVIHNTLPSYFCKFDIPSIGLFYYETDSFRGSNWQYSCNLMDEIWVVTKDNVDMCKKSGVTTRIREIDYPVVDNSTHNNFLSMPHAEGTYKFYSISELSYRKGVSSLIAYYYQAFSASDNVSLTLKVFSSGKNAQETEEEISRVIEQTCSQIRKGSKEDFPPIYTICSRLSSEDMLGLHNTCDCYVSCSRGEALCLPAVDAATHGNSVIFPKWNGPNKYIDSPYGIDCVKKPVFGMPKAYPNLYMFDEEWREPIGTQVIEKLRQAYRERKPCNVKNMLKKFSMTSCGFKMRDLLYEHESSDCS